MAAKARRPPRAPCDARAHWALLGSLSADPQWMDPLQQLRHWHPASKASKQASKHQQNTSDLFPAEESCETFCLSRIANSSNNNKNNLYSSSIQFVSATLRGAGQLLFANCRLPCFCSRDRSSRSLTSAFAVLVVAAVAAFQSPFTSTQSTCSLPQGSSAVPSRLRLVRYAHICSLPIFMEA